MALLIRFVLTLLSIVGAADAAASPSRIFFGKIG